ncbi:hypothetical protein [Salibacterium aidingense]|uniref:hypothetical protein n=1 Tax=Salibacterium aidingense TaxID=384933 RepID=UPI0003FAC6FC|nr:hypothetical protein [Salibacterium aidingense]
MKQVTIEHMKKIQHKIILFLILGLGIGGMCGATLMVSSLAEAYDLPFATGFIVPLVVGLIAAIVSNYREIKKGSKEKITGIILTVIFIVIMGYLFMNPGTLTKFIEFF